MKSESLPQSRFVSVHCLFTLLLGIAFWSATPARATLIHRWSFTETNGPIVDSIGIANGSVVLVGTNAVRTNGVLRLAGGTRATTDYGQFPSNLVHGLTNISIEVWAKPLAAQNWSRIFDFGPGNDTQANNFFLSFCRGTVLNQQRLEFGAPAAWTLDTGLTTATGTEYYYTVTWSPTGGTNGGGLAQWYRNGALAGSISTGTSSVSNVNDTVLWLGRSQYVPDSTANAEFDEVRIYDTILTQSQITSNFAAGPDSLTLPAPVAVNDSMTLNPEAIALINVLQNDQAVGAPLDSNTVVVITAPKSGTAVVKSGGRILYTHNGGPATNDQFTYFVKDRLGSSSQPATVSITINPALRLANTTITIPGTPPPVAYQIVDAFPGIVFTNPLALRTPQGAAYSNMLFVVERNGVISYIPDVTAANPVKQILVNIGPHEAYDTNNPADGELGLLSMDFHPGFATNGLFYVFYTAPNGATWFDRLSRFTANPTNLTVATNTQQILFNMPDREFNHNGGDLHFGLDGYLYCSVGDEGGQYNVHSNAQRLDLNLFSGILRIDVDKKPGSIIPTLNASIPTDGSGHAFYNIPADNPFLGVTNLYGRAVDTNKLRGEFYAIGFRHPWRFSIDPQTGDVWAGDVGQDLYEEVEIVRKGGNYGWPYYEGNHLTTTLYPTQPGMLPPPAGYVMDPPMFEYDHPAVTGSDPQFTGQDVNGSLVYHGSRIPQLTNAYLFGDFDVGGSVWALHRLTNNGVSVERLTGEPGGAAFGADPHNGDLLICNYLQNKVKRLVLQDVSAGTAFPTNLSDTGIFADMNSLTPNPGIVSYEPIVTFWSDYAGKRRWFTIPDTTNTIGFAEDGNWTLPTGMKWFKHFDLELERGNPATKRRIETRVIVKTDSGIYGVSYKWNSAQTDATLAPDGGDVFQLTVTNNGLPEQQTWEIPSRSSCLSCHTAVGGYALTFNTREMNKSFNMNGVTSNQIATMSQAGYFSAPVAHLHTLPAFATSTDTTCSVSFRARSYLAVNCGQCHQPGGSGPGWDARPWLTLEQTGLINGIAGSNNGGDPANKLIVPGDTNHSILLTRLQNTNGLRMPPLATHELDTNAIQLIAQWITTDLTNYQTFNQWQTSFFGSTNSPDALAAADPDQDGAGNFFEFLTHTDPKNKNDVWHLGINLAPGVLNITYPQVPNIGVVIDTSADLINWTPWDIAGNQPFFAATTGTVQLQTPLSPSSPSQYFRARIIPP